MITRRNLIRNTAAAAVAAPLVAPMFAAPGGGRLKQSACRWCYSKVSLDDLCRNAQRIGLKGIDLVSPNDWPTVQKYGLMPSMVPGAGNIPDCWNRPDN